MNFEPYMIARSALRVDAIAKAIETICEDARTKCPSAVIQTIWYDYSLQRRPNLDTQIVLYVDGEPASVHVGRWASETRYVVEPAPEIVP